MRWDHMGGLNRRHRGQRMRSLAASIDYGHPLVGTALSAWKRRIHAICESRGKKFDGLAEWQTGRVRAMMVIKTTFGEYPIGLVK